MLTVEDLSVPVCLKIQLNLRTILNPIRGLVNAAWCEMFDRRGTGTENAQLSLNLHGCSDRASFQSGGVMCAFPTVKHALSLSRSV